MSELPVDLEKFHKELVEKNPCVAESVVRASQRMEEQLQRLGVDLRPRYSLTPPLGNILRAATMPGRSSGDSA